MPAIHSASRSLNLYAGPTALRLIRERGLHQEHFQALIGASGGPKWFVLYGIDRYLAGRFFAGRSEPLLTAGSSAGAWRMACLSMAEPVSALERLAHHYSRQCYSAAPDAREISAEAALLLRRVLGETGAQEIVDNAVFRLNIFANRSRGLLSAERRALLLPALVLSGLSNALSRRTLQLFFERVIFYHPGAGRCYWQLQDLKTRYVPLSAANVQAALMASGSIPLLLEGVRDIAEAPPGVYRDGGITDYHFDMPFYGGLPCPPEQSRDGEPGAPREAEGLVLYPHFYSRVTPGWFDKHLPWRRVTPAHFHNVLLVAPSPEFVSRLPYGKIPDRRDFETLDDASRIRYWDTVMAASEKMAEEFAALVETGAGIEHIRPFDIKAEN